MLEIEDGPRLKHYFNNTMSDSMKEGLAVLADTLGVSAAPHYTAIEISPSTTIATTATSTSASTMTTTTTKTTTTNDGLTSADGDVVVPRRAPLVDERLVNRLLTHIGLDKTRPTTWNDRPFAKYKKVI